MAKNKTHEMNPFYYSFMRFDKIDDDENAEIDHVNQADESIKKMEKINSIKMDFSIKEIKKYNFFIQSNERNIKFNLLF